MQLKPITAIIVLFLVVASLSVAGCTDPAAGKKQAIVNDVLPLISKFNETIPRYGHSNILINGQCLIWDVSANKQSNAQDMLPSELRMSESSSNVTVFLINGTEDWATGEYSISGAKAYEKIAYIDVVYWPQKVAVGHDRVFASTTPKEREVQQKPEYSDPTQAIAQWLEGLGKAPVMAKGTASNSKVSVTVTYKGTYISDNKSIQPHTGHKFVQFNANITNVKSNNTTFWDVVGLPGHLILFDSNNDGHEAVRQLSGEGRVVYEISQSANPVSFIFNDWDNNLVILL